MCEYSDVFWQIELLDTRCLRPLCEVQSQCMGTGGFKFPHHTCVWKVWEPSRVQYSAVSSGDICTFSRGNSPPVSNSAHTPFCRVKLKRKQEEKHIFHWRGIKCYSVPLFYTSKVLMLKKYGHTFVVASFPNMFCDWLFSHVKDTLSQMYVSLHLTVQGYVYFNPSIFFSTFPPCRERGVQAGDSTAVWGFRGNHRWSSGRRCCKDPTGPAPPQTHMLSTAGREGERAGGRRHGPRRPRGQRSRRGQGPERSQWVWQDTAVEMLWVWITVLPTNSECHRQK